MASGWSGSGAPPPRRSFAEGQEVCWEEMWHGGGGAAGGRGHLVEEDSALDGFAADRALAHSVAAQLAGAVAAHEDHVLQPVQAHGTHGLQAEAERRVGTRACGVIEPQRRREQNLTCSFMSWSCCWSFCTSAFTLVLSLSRCRAGMFPLAALARQQKKCAGVGGCGEKSFSYQPIRNINHSSSGHIKPYLLIKIKCAAN